MTSSLHSNSSSTPYTKFEQTWFNCAKKRCHGLIPRRKMSYDPKSLMFYTDVIYEETLLGDSDLSLPDESWLKNGIIEFVLGGFNPPDRGSCPPLKRNEEQIYVSDEIIERRLEKYESEMVYGGLLEKIIFDDKMSMAEKIHAILSHPVVGNRENLKLYPPELLKSKIQPLERQRIPIQILLPAFPFKDQNPFRTAVKPSHVDLGEVDLLIRLHVLALALTQVYPFGVEWVIVCDGIVYSKTFGVTEKDAIDYQAKLRSFRNRLNLQETIHIIDFKELVEQISEFRTLQNLIIDALQNLYKTDLLVKQKIDKLTRNMKWNLNTRIYLDSYDWRELWNVLNFDTSKDMVLSSKEQELQQMIYDLATKTAYEYASFNLTAKKLKLTEIFFPYSLRATTHPKNKQIALPYAQKDNDIPYPWNGTACVNGPVDRLNSVKVMYLYEILRNKTCKTCSLYGINDPFYFEI